MNLNQLFEMQRELDKRIEKDHPRVYGENRELKKVLALLTELGELANELPETFKFWANKKNNYERALMEFVDGIHFLLSFSLEFGIDDIEIDSDYTEATELETFTKVFRWVSGIANTLTNHPVLVTIMIKDQLEEVFNLYIGLGKKIGFTSEQIHAAYFAKNQINHARQDAGY